LISNTLSPARQALSHPDFARYAYGRFAATLAWQMIDVVLGYQVWKLTHKEAYLGYIGLAQFLPFVVLLLPGGQIADRFDRRLIIALAYGLELIAAAALLLFTMTGQSAVMLLFFIAALLGVGRSFWAPAGQAMVPNLVPKELLSGAISFNTLLFTIATITGPAVAGLTLILGIDWSYGIAVVLLIGAMFMILGVKPVRAKSSAEWRWSDFLGGFVFVWRKKPVLGAISLDLFAVLLGGATAMLPVYAKDVLHVGASGLGDLRAAPAAGSALTALFFAFRPLKHNVGVKMLVAVGLFGAATVGFGVSRWMPLSLGCLAILGAADMVSVYVRQSLIQIWTPDEMRGRVGAVSSLFISGSNELGEAESGFLAALVGPVTAVVAGGIGAVLVAFAWSRWFPELRRARSFAPPKSFEDIPLEEKAA